MISIVIPVHNQLPLIKDIYHQLIYSSLGLSNDIILVDDNSTDGTSDWLKSRSMSDIRILSNSKRNRWHLIGSINEGVREAKNNNVLIMKPNIRIDADTIKGMDKALDDHIIVNPDYQRGMQDKQYRESYKVLEQCFAIRRNSGLFPIGDNLLCNYLGDRLWRASNRDVGFSGLIRIVDDIKPNVTYNMLMYRALQKDGKRRDLICANNGWK